MNPYINLKDYTPDGEPHVFGDRVYIYTSHDIAHGNDFCMQDYVVYSAPLNDLNNWTNKGISYSSKQDPMYDDKHKYMYAPDCVKGNDGKYYLYYSMGGYTNPIAVAVSDYPDKDFKFLGYVKTEDGKTFVGKYVTFDPAVINDDGTIRLYFGAYYPFKGMHLPNFMIKHILPKIFEGRDDIIMGAFNVILADDMLTIKSPIYETITEEQEISEYKSAPFFEASSIRKVNDTYYFIYSSWYNHELMYATSKDPTTGFKFRGRIVSNCDVGINGFTLARPSCPSGNNHGSIEKVNDDYYVFYHRQTHNTSYSRQACVEKIHINDDYSIDQVEITSLGFESVLKDTGTYKADYYCEIHNNKPYSRLVRNGAGKGNPPYLTSDEHDTFLTNITNNVTVGYKYFDFKESRNASLSLQGNFKGNIEVLVNGIVSSTTKVDINNEKYNDVIVPVNANGKTYLAFRFKGKGSLNFNKFTLK